MLPRGSRVLVEAVVVADSGAGAVLVEVRGPAGTTLPPVAVLAPTVHPDARYFPGALNPSCLPG